MLNLHCLKKVPTFKLSVTLSNLKLHFKCTDFNSSTRVTVYAVCIYVFL